MGTLAKRMVGAVAVGLMALGATIGLGQHQVRPQAIIVLCTPDNLPGCLLAPPCGGYNLRGMHCD